jgi:hypothetical protein
MRMSTREKCPVFDTKGGAVMPAYKADVREPSLDEWHMRPPVGGRSVRRIQAEMNPSSEEETGMIARTGQTVAFLDRHFRVAACCQGVRGEGGESEALIVA